MFESAIRANAARLQRVYDAMPYPVQNLLTSTRGLFLARYRYSQANARYLRELRSRESWTQEQISEYQLRVLNQLL